ncbi:SDR family NAD(P)-dependent oxidoreductase [Candidatus Halobonum tyrrellensis]|uniref:Short-chain dehydrogenase/reductase SDR n=1 Tax=Candidatus Halobonum tyrrellensis G22 TaxID=1324957 RepID=V4IXS8_9EURY|nr:SDR family NAD(P)-dependent oxidoreductase [Candidatus Halobonum tyrrellensis]ESP87967.1 short-chain dehydrogenase/reductase SDR [Candidatus Halobonum tyrrellensis G22]
MTTAVIAGVGPGLGESVARRFAAEGCDVGLLARSGDYLDGLAADLPTDAAAVPTDLADPDDVAAAFETVRERLGPVDVLVNHASAASWTGLLDTDREAFDRAYEVGPRAGFLCAREAVPDMLDGDAEGSESGSGGTVIFTGATTAVRGREGAVGFSMAKFGSRGLAQSMARELGPEGVHVAHVVVDGGIRPPDREVDDPEEYLDPDAIADSYWHLVEQDPSAWTLELDLRPHVEEF